MALLLARRCWRVANWYWERLVASGQSSPTFLLDVISCSNCWKLYSMFGEAGGGFHNDFTYSFLFVKLLLSLPAKIYFKQICRWSLENVSSNTWVFGCSSCKQNLRPRPRLRRLPKSSGEDWIILMRRRSWYVFFGSIIILSHCHVFSN